ncbi:MAG: SpoIIE family protein phosphatase [Pyrinomonadaceae bacterium]
MRRRVVHQASVRVKRILAGVRLFLRRMMPRVAIVALVSFILWELLHKRSWYQDSPLDAPLGLITFFTVFAAAAYYGFKGLRWLKRRLLWRVRWRLVVTYSFVGLTPILLLTTLGVFFAVSISVADYPRMVTSHLEEKKKEVTRSARSLASGFERLPANADDKRIQSWLDEQTTLLQASLPGARTALWRGKAEDAASLGHKEDAPFVSAPGDETTRGVGTDNTLVGAQLPAWLKDRDEWSGLAFVGAASDEENGQLPFASIRAVARSNANGRSVALLLVVPVSRAFVQQLRESAGVEIHPMFVGSSTVTINAGTSGGEEKQSVEIEPQKQDNSGAKTTGGGRKGKITLNKDQFGETITPPFSPIFLNATEWATGETKEHLTFMFKWTWADTTKQLLAGSEIAQALRYALIFIAGFFLLLELLALFSAGWMTRAVTGTVHKLYRATQFIKRGDFSHRVRVRSHDQLGELAEAFNEMSANIESLLQERVERERLQREVEIAAEVQAQLFPRRVPEMKTAEISAECRAARGVAGDYYDYVEITPGLVLIALGDVSGKGVSASLVMSNLQAALRAQAAIVTERFSIAERAVAVSAGSGSGGSSSKVLAHIVADAEVDGTVSRIARNINEQLCESTDANRFATLFLAIYEDRTRTLRYTNAGHNAPVLVRADGKVERLERGGMMTGAFDWAEYEEASITLHRGDTLLSFSDGISEADNATGEEYGEDRLVQFTTRHRDLPAEDLRHAVFEEIDAWSGTQERGDDQTLVIVKSNW